jgi:hypothetical protein
MSEDKVKRIVPATVAPVPEVIDICERLLEMAKSGELRSIVMCGALTENRFHTVIETHDLIESMGLVSMMQWRVGNLSQNATQN